MSESEKYKIAVRLTPENERLLEHWYKSTGCKSKNEFMNEALRWYTDYLKAGDASAFLPVSVGAAIDGKLDGFQQQLSRLVFKLAAQVATTGMVTAYNSQYIDDDTLADLEQMALRYTRSVNGNVKMSDIEEIVQGKYGG